MALSDLDVNLFGKVLRYKNGLGYHMAELELQPISEHLAQPRDLSINYAKAPQERIAKRLYKQNKKLNNEEIKELVTAYESGLTVYQLAKQFGCHRTTVSQHLKARGVEIRNRPMTEEQIDEAARLYESGLSLVKVGKIIGVDAETIHRRLRERGVRMRGAHDR